MALIEPKALRRLADELGGLEDKLAAINEAKKAVYARIKKDHGKLAVDSMKSAMRWLRMDPSRRDDQFNVDAEARRIVEILQGNQDQQLPKLQVVSEATGARPVHPGAADVTPSNNGSKDTQPDEIGFDLQEAALTVDRAPDCDSSQAPEGDGGMMAPQFGIVDQKLADLEGKLSPVLQAKEDLYARGRTSSNTSDLDESDDLDLSEAA